MTQLDRGGRSRPDPGSPAGLNDGMYEHSRRTLTIASLAVLATFLDTTILYVAFPDITATFSGTSASELSWVLNAYTIVFAAMLIPAGKLADRVGHRKVFLAGSTVFTVASMACGLAPTAELLIVFRIVQAVGAAALIPSSLALVMHAFAHDQLPRAVAIWGAAGAVAGALGPTLGAAIVEGLGWRWAFFINLPVGIYTVIAGRRNLHESSDPETQVPSARGRHPHRRCRRAAVLRPGRHRGVRVAQRPDPRRPRRRPGRARRVRRSISGTPRRRHSTSTCSASPTSGGRTVAMLVFGTAFAALFFGSILFLTEVWGWSVLQAGFGVAPGPVVVGLVAPQAGKLAGTIGQRPILITGGVLFAAAACSACRCSAPTSTTCATTSRRWSSAGSASRSCSPSSPASSRRPCRPAAPVSAAPSPKPSASSAARSGSPSRSRSSAPPAPAVDGFDPIWWIVVVGGLATSALVLPMRTSTARHHVSANVDVPARS